MHLVQLFLPLRAQDGTSIPTSVLRSVRAELLERFGGLTAHVRAPVQGLWDNDGEVEQDDIVIMEVVVDTFDDAWWSDYKKTLERRLAQKEIHGRVMSLSLL
jgi:hypothetical protein